MHKTFAAHDPVPAIPPEDITSVAKQNISFISVPGSDVRVTGPFRQALKPLLVRYGIEDTQPGKVTLPCITMQIPVIKRYHPEMVVVLQDAFQAESQSGIRTVTVPFFDCEFRTILHTVVKVLDN